MQWLVRDPDNRVNGRLAPKPQAASGVWIDVNRLSVWLTAGHVVNGIKQQLDHDMAFRFSFVDRDDTKDHSLRCVPFSPKLTPLFTSEHDQLGLDIGGLVLRPLEREALLKGPCRPFFAKYLARQDEKFDLYAVYGSPEYARTNEVRPTATGGVVHTKVGCALIPLERLRARPAWRTPARRLHFRLLGDPATSEWDAPTPYSVVGMSGGPIWGIRFDERGFQARLVGIQASQSREAEELVLHVCPVRWFLRSVRARIEKLRLEQRSINAA